MDEEREEQDPFERVGVERAKEILEAGGAQLIDVREPAEWKQGHIPQAVHVPLGTLLARPQDFLTRDNIVFQCAEGVRSAVACEIAASLGFTKLYNMEGGINAWAARGYPIAR